MKKTTPISITLICLLAFITACNPARKTQKRQAKREENSKILLQKHLGQSPDSKFIILKGKGKFNEGNQSLSFTYRIHLADDSLIWSNFSVYGISGAQGLANQDSVYLRTTFPNKEIHICGLASLQKWLGIEAELNIVQNVLLGVAELDPATISNITENNEAFVFLENKNSYQLRWHIDKRNATLQKLTAEDAALGRNTSISYSQPAAFGKMLIPQQIEIKMTQPRQLSLRLTHTKTILNPEKISFSFKMPASYARKYCNK